MKERRDAAKQRRQQAVRDRRAQRARSKTQLAKLREEFPSRVLLSRYPVPELGHVFDELSDPATQLLEETCEGISALTTADCPVCRALRIPHPRQVAPVDCRFPVGSAGARLIFDRAFDPFIGPRKTFPFPGKTFDLVKGKWASLLAAAAFLGRESTGNTHVPVSHAQSA